MVFQSSCQIYDCIAPAVLPREVSCTLGIANARRAWAFSYIILLIAGCMCTRDLNPCKPALFHDRESPHRTHHLRKHGIWHWEPQTESGLGTGSHATYIFSLALLKGRMQTIPYSAKLTLKFCLGFWRAQVHNSRRWGRQAKTTAQYLNGQCMPDP